MRPPHPPGRGRARGSPCSTSAPPPPPPVCPTALFLQGAERTASYRPGSERQPDALRHLAVMTNLASGCRYGEDGVDMDLAFDLIAERGPALAGISAELQFSTPH